jgi:STE24 endopeptidase
LIFFYCLSLALDHKYLYEMFLIERSSKYMGLVLLSMIISVIMAYFNPLFHLVNWKFESDADRYAFNLLENKEALKTMLIKLAAQNLSNLVPHPLYARFHYSHPPILERLRNLGFVEQKA